MTDLQELIGKVPGLEERAAEYERIDDSTLPQVGDLTVGDATAAAVEKVLEKGWHIALDTSGRYGVYRDTGYGGLVAVSHAPKLLDACVAALAGEGGGE